MEKSTDTKNKIQKKKVKRILNKLGHGDVSVKIISRGHSTKIYVRKTVGGDTYIVSSSVSYRQLANILDTSQIVGSIADKIDAKMETTIIKGEAHITIIPYDEPEATCRKCRKSSQLPSKVSSTITDKSDNSFSATPTFKSGPEKINSFDDYERLLLSLYLFEKVRRVCDHDQKF